MSSMTTDTTSPESAGVHTDDDTVRGRVRARIDAWWEAALEDADRRGRGHALAWPRRLHTHVYDRNGFRAVRIGTAVMLRAGRPEKEEKGKGAKKGERRGGQEIAGLGILAVIGIGTAGQAAILHPYPATVGGVCLLLVWMPSAWLVGSWKITREQQEKPLVQQADSADVPEAGVAPEDAGEDEPLADSEPLTYWWNEPSPERSQQLFLEWIRAWMKGGNVHLRTLLDDLIRTPETAHHTAASLKEELGRRGVPWRGSVRAPVFDPLTGLEDTSRRGNRNREGIHRSDVPAVHNPYPVPKTTLIRLLPRLQVPDQQ